MLPPLSTPPPPLTIVDYHSPWGQFVLSLDRAEDYSNDATQSFQATPYICVVGRETLCCYCYCYYYYYYY